MNEIEHLLRILFQDIKPAIISILITILFAACKYLYLKFSGDQAINEKKWKAKIFYFGSLPILIVMYLLSALYIDNIKKENELDIKNRELIGKHIIQLNLYAIKLRADFEMLPQHDYSYSDHTESEKILINNIINKGRTVVKDLSRIEDDDINIGNQIYKYDIQQYICTILAQLLLSRYTEESNYYYQLGMNATNKVLELIKDVEIISKKKGSDSYEFSVLNWINDQEIKNRMYFNRAWLVGIKALSDDLVNKLEYEEYLNQISKVDKYYRDNKKFLFYNNPVLSYFYKKTLNEPYDN